MSRQTWRRISTAGCGRGTLARRGWKNVEHVDTFERVERANVKSVKGDSHGQGLHALVPRRPLRDVHPLGHLRHPRARRVGAQRRKASATRRTSPTSTPSTRSTTIRPSGRRAARQAGMKYAVMTTKHHDGFCLFDSQHTDYKATNTPARRDLTREYVEAFRAEGLKVGFYYSLLDWHHPDYPIAGDRFHPMRNHPDYKDHAGNLSRYADYLHAPGGRAADQLRQDRHHLVRLLLRRPERRGVARHRAGQDGARAPAGDHHRQPPGRQHQGGRAGDLRRRLRLARADHPARGRDERSWASRSPGRPASP